MTWLTSCHQVVLSVRSLSFPYCRLSLLLAPSWDLCASVYQPQTRVASLPHAVWSPPPLWFLNHQCSRSPKLHTHTEHISPGGSPVHFWEMYWGWWCFQQDVPLCHFHRRSILLLPFRNHINILPELEKIICLCCFKFQKRGSPPDISFKVSIGGRGGVHELDPLSEIPTGTKPGPVRQAAEVCFRTPLLGWPVQQPDFNRGMGWDGMGGEVIRLIHTLNGWWTDAHRNAVFGRGTWAALMRIS